MKIFFQNITRLKSSVVCKSGEMAQVSIFIAPKITKNKVDNYVDS